MADFTIQIDGMEMLGRNLDNYVQNLRVAANDRTQEAGLNTQAGAKRGCPVDTGRLRSSILYKSNNTGVNTFGSQVGSNVRYAAAVHNGHITRSGSHVAARPFLFNAFVQERQAYLNDMKRLVNQ